MLFEDMLFGGGEECCSTILVKNIVASSLFDSYFFSPIIAFTLNGENDPLPAGLEGNNGAFIEKTSQLSHGVHCFSLLALTLTFS